MACGRHRDLSARRTEKMPRLLAKKRMAAALLMVGLALYQAACGTIIHPERRGFALRVQPT